MRVGFVFHHRHHRHPATLHYSRQHVAYVHTTSQYQQRLRVVNNQNVKMIQRSKSFPRFTIILYFPMLFYIKDTFLYLRDDATRRHTTLHHHHITRRYTTTTPHDACTATTPHDAAPHDATPPPPHNTTTTRRYNTTLKQHTHTHTPHTPHHTTPHHTHTQHCTTLHYTTMCIYMHLYVCLHVCVLYAFGCVRARTISRLRRRT